MNKIPPLHLFLQFLCMGDVTLTGMRNVAIEMLNAEMAFASVLTDIMLNMEYAVSLQYLSY